MNQIHLPPRTPMSCCLATVLLGMLFFSFASALHSWAGLECTWTSRSTDPDSLAPQKAGNQVGQVHVSGRERRDSHHYYTVAFQQKTLLAGAGPWEPQSDSSHFSLYLLQRAYLLPTNFRSYLFLPFLKS